MRTNTYYSKYLWRILWFLALLIRLIGLDQSLWLDEATTAQVARHMSALQIISSYSPTDFHPPLFYLIVKYWGTLFGYHEVGLRLLSVVLSLGAGYVVYRLTKAIFLASPKNIGQSAQNIEHQASTAAALFLFNPLILYYSQEARMYMMIVFLTAVLLYAAYPIFVSGRVRFSVGQLVGMNLSIAALFATGYASAFFIASLHLIFMLRRRWRELFCIVPGGLISLAIHYPLLTAQMEYANTRLADISNWSLVLGKAELKNLLLIPVKVVSGRYDLASSADYILVIAMCAVWTAIAMYSLFTLRTRTQMSRAAILGLLSMILVPIMLGYTLSFFKPMMQYFRFLPVVVPLCVMCGIVVRKRLFQRILLLGSVMFCLIYVGDSRHHREDWKGLTATLPPSSTVYMIPSSADPIKYYRPDITVVDIAQVSTARSRDVVVIPYVFEIHGVDAEALRVNSGRTVREARVFNHLTYERWSR